MTEKKLQKQGRISTKFRGGGGKNFSGWPEYIPLQQPTHLLRYPDPGDAGLRDVEGAHAEGAPVQEYLRLGLAKLKEIKGLYVGSRNTICVLFNNMLLFFE